MVGLVGYTEQAGGRIGTTLICQELWQEDEREREGEREERFGV